MLDLLQEVSDRVTALSKCLVQTSLLNVANLANNTEDVVCSFIYENTKKISFVYYAV